MSPTICYLYEHEDVSTGLAMYHLATNKQQKEPAYKTHAVNLEVTQGKVGICCCTFFFTFFLGNRRIVHPPSSDKGTERT